MIRKSKRVQFIRDRCIAGRFKCDATGVIYFDNAPLKSYVSNEYYCVTVPGYTYPISAHIIIAYLKFGDAAIMQGVEVRHLNDTKLDNSWVNIGIGTRKQNAQDMSPEKRRAIALKVAEKVGHEGAKLRAQLIWSKLTPEERQSRHKAMTNGMTPEQRSARSVKAATSMSKEARIERSRTAALKMTQEARMKGVMSRGDRVVTNDEVHKVRSLYSQRDIKGKRLYTQSQLSTKFQIPLGTIEAIIGCKGRFSNI